MDRSVLVDEISNKLTWSNITVASRIMLPTYMILFAMLGVNYLTITSERFSKSPGLLFANDNVMDLRGWGAVFLVSVACMVVAIALKNRMLFRYALFLGIIVMSVWSGVIAAAALFGNASLTGWCWPAFVAIACYASNESLLAGEN